MKLHIENFRKIAVADLDFKGMTVIVGDNNTGKSTVGKLLFSLFDLYSSVDEQVKVARRNFIVNGGRFPALPGLDIDALIDNPVLTEKMLFDILSQSPGLFPISVEGNTRQDGVVQASAKTDWLRQLAKDLFSRIEASRKIPVRHFLLMHAMTGLGNYFYGPLIPKHDGDVADTRIRLEVRGKAIDIRISGDSFSCNEDVALLHKGWFIGSPSLLNAISQEREDDYMERVHRPLLRKMLENTNGDIVGAALADEKLRPIMAQLKTLLPGAFAQRKNYKILDFKSEEFPEGIPVESLSMGLKAFALLRLMLERGVLQEKDVLVLDEPENHLHPSWQLVYAEIIVLLQKAFGLTVLLTTHSPYFLDAVRTYSAKHGTKDILTVYTPKERLTDSPTPMKSQVEFVDITNDVGKLHGSFAAPLRDLRNLAGEFE